jgi:stearoyl-CoA desaturase (Delta-9 desaturase)
MNDAVAPKAPLTWEKVRWETLVPQVVMYVLTLGVFFVPLDRTTLVLFAVSYFIRTVAASVGFHRYFAHRSFRTSRPMQFILGLLGTLNLQGSLLWWADTHRQHHRHADTEDDIHSPSFKGFLYAHYGWYMNRDNQVPDLERVKDLARFPELVWLSRYHVLVFTVYAAIITWFFGVAGLVWSVCLPTVILWELTHWIQSFSHSFGGYRRWKDSPDKARNHWLVGLLTFGEFHNNHHAFSSSAKQGHVWWEIDIGYYILKGLETVGLVWDVNVPRKVLLGPQAVSES